MGESAKLDKLRFEQAEVPLASLSRVDAQGEDANPKAECPPSPDWIDGVVQIAQHLSIGCSGTAKGGAECIPCSIKALLRRRSGCTVQMVLECLVTRRNTRARQHQVDSIREVRGSIMLRTPAVVEKFSSLLPRELCQLVVACMYKRSGEGNRPHVGASPWRRPVTQQPLNVRMYMYPGVSWCMHYCSSGVSGLDSHKEMQGEEERLHMFHGRNHLPQ